MLILLLCILLNSVIGVAFKLFAKYKIENQQAIVVNYFVCVLTAYFVVGKSPIQFEHVDQSWFIPSIILGALFIIVFNIMALTVQNFGIVVASIFQKMSLLAPTLIAIFLLGESSGLIKWIGIIASLIAIVLFSYNKDKEILSDSKTNKWILALPVLTFVGSCLIDSSLLFIESKQLIQGQEVAFTSMVFFIAGFLGLIHLSYKYLIGKIEFAWKNLYAGVLLGIPNFFSIYVLLLALNQGIDGSVLFPLNNVGILIFTATFGIVFFNERLTKLKIIGFGLAVFAIITITFSEWIQS
jgi:drug/metabolite transporter (DMT)-like permease